MYPYIAQGRSPIPDIANVDAGAVAWLIQTQTMREHRHLLVDGTLRTPERALNSIHALHAAGYRVELHGMAVHPDLSHARTYLRREQEIRRSSSGFGRAVDDDFHHAAVTGYAASLKTLFENKSVNRMVLYDHHSRVMSDVTLQSDKWKLTDSGAAVPEQQHPVILLHQTHTAPDGLTLHKTAETWRQSRLLAAARLPPAPDLEQLAIHERAAAAKLQAAVIQPSPSTTYRGLIVAVDGDVVLQAVGAHLVRHRRPTLTGAGKDVLTTLGTDVKIAYGRHTDIGLIQTNGCTRSRSR